MQAQQIFATAQIRAREAAAIAAGIPETTLMERAGAGVVAQMLVERADLMVPGTAALVVCGPGNNGGDGYVVARLLRQRGLDVTVQHYGDAARQPPAAAEARRRWLEAGGTVEPFPTDLEAMANPDLLVDAVFGGGFDRAMPRDLAEALVLLDSIASYGNCWRIAIDGPTGLDLDTGRARFAPGERIILNFDLTVTFEGVRPGHLLLEGPFLCGRVVVVSLDLPAADQRPIGELVGPPSPVELDKRAYDSSGPAHKYAHGHLLVLAGGPGKGGAARLAARAGLRIGAGVVTLACPPEALAENTARLDAVMLHPLADDPQALADWMDARRVTALVLGPGLGRERARALVPAVLASGWPCVLDADALTAFEDDPAALFTLLHEGAVLTPHPGEFARLFPDLAPCLRPPVRGLQEALERLDPAFRNPRKRPSPDMWAAAAALLAKADAEVRPARPLTAFDAVREAGARAGATVLLKGPLTLIACSSIRVPVDAHAAIGADAAPWLATAGSGDVLAGMIGGLMARGGGLHGAVRRAVWLHAEAARRFGPGLIAEDLPDMLPPVLAALG